MKGCICIMSRDEKINRASKSSSKKPELKDHSSGNREELSQMTAVNAYLDACGTAMSSELTGMMAIPPLDDDELESYMDLLKKEL